MLKNIRKQLLAVLGALAIIATIGAWIAPEAPKWIWTHLAALLSWLWSSATSLVPVPGWILALLFLGLGLAFYLGWLSARLASEGKPRLASLSLHELSVLHALISLDGKHITHAEVSTRLRISNLEAEIAMSRLEKKSLISYFMTPVLSMSYGVTGGDIEYFLTAEGREFAMVNISKIKTAISKSAN